MASPANQQGIWPRYSNLLENALFGPPSQGPAPLARLLRVLRYPYAILRDLIGGELTLRATGLVYATLLALIPAIALSFAVLRAFDAHRDLEPFLIEFFRPVGDAGPALVLRLMEFAERVSAGLVGMVGLVLLLWTLVGTVKKIEDSMNFVWRVRRARSIPRRMLEFVILVIVGPLVVATVIAFAKLAFDSVASHAPGDFTLGRQLLQLVMALAPYAIVTSLFTAVYMLMPNTRVHFVPALAGGLAAGVLWAAIGKAFTALVLYTTRLTLVYAGFAIVVVVFLWIYLSWLILLAGAQLAFYLQNPNYLQLGHATLRLSNSEQERLALDIMARVAQSHHDGAAPWSVENLGRELALPGVAIADIVDQLELRGLVIQTDSGRLFPAREISAIRLTEVIDCARTIRSGDIPEQAKSPPAVRQLHESMERAWRDACGERTLVDLLRPENPRAD